MKKLNIYYIPDLQDMYDDTNHQQEGFPTKKGHVLANPKIYPPYVYGCDIKVGDKPINSEHLHSEKHFEVYESWDNKVQVITIVPNDVEIEIVNKSLDTEKEQMDFFENKEKYIEEWRK
jgi:hypothetical protein